ncbi:MAG TPA: globin family protein [Acidimicrobiales bacterium]|nr:globin family protein [Acidimicrobiales bacterium]
MTPEQIRLVQDSFANVVPIADTAANLFYGRLFELDPSVRAMFTGDLDEQGKKLMRMIGIAVNNLNNLGSIVRAVETMGARHAGYGVKDEHYDTVAEALLWTLAQAFRDKFTPELEGAWTAAYGILAETMKAAAKGQAA